jgi:hypothetical protein
MSKFFRTHLLYTLQCQENGSYIALNRDYKPIGFRTKKHLIYSDYPIEIHFAKKLSLITVKVLSFNNSDNTKEIFLYNDGCVPTQSDYNMQEYLIRLRRLASLQLKTLY